MRGNHQAVLTEILSDFFDGKQTMVLYLGNQVLHSMTQEAIEDLIGIHKNNINSIKRLPKFPKILNIDQINPTTKTLFIVAPTLGQIPSGHLTVRSYSAMPKMEAKTKYVSLGPRTTDQHCATNSSKVSSTNKNTILLFSSTTYWI
jgi:hypothetical protein